MLADMSTSSLSPRAILITGASSGIGAAIAREYAEGGVFLALSGRNAERLAAVAQDCRDAGADVEARPVDVVDRAGMADWIEGIDDSHPLDLVIANAGISSGTSGVDDFDPRTRKVFDINVGGVFNTVHPILPRMRRRGRGQIAIMSSIAGFRGIPGATAYAASKAAVRSYGEGLRGLVKAEGLRVSVICPGYVVSAMTAKNDFPMPLIMPAERAARIIRRGLARDKARIAFPWPMYFTTWLASVIPPGWTDPIFARLPRKE